MQVHQATQAQLKLLQTAMLLHLEDPQAAEEGEEGAEATATDHADQGQTTAISVAHLSQQQ